MVQKMNISMTRTYSVTMLHVGKVSDLANRFGVSQGSVVRAAIDLLWNEVEEGAVIVDDAARKPRQVVIDGDGGAELGSSI